MAEGRQQALYSELMESIQSGAFRENIDEKAAEMLLLLSPRLFMEYYVALIQESKDCTDVSAFGNLMIRLPWPKHFNGCRMDRGPLHWLADFCMVSKLTYPHTALMATCPLKDCNGQTALDILIEREQELPSASIVAADKQTFEKSIPDNIYPLMCYNMLVKAEGNNLYVTSHLFGVSTKWHLLEDYDTSFVTFLVESLMLDAFGIRDSALKSLHDSPRDAVFTMDSFSFQSLPLNGSYRRFNQFPAEMPTIAKERALRMLRLLLNNILNDRLSSTDNIDFSILRQCRKRITLEEIRIAYARKQHARFPLFNGKIAAEDLFNIDDEEIQSLFLRVFPYAASKKTLARRFENYEFAFTLMHFEHCFQYDSPPDIFSAMEKVTTRVVRFAKMNNLQLPTKLVHQYACLLQSFRWGSLETDSKKWNLLQHFFRNTAVQALSMEALRNHKVYLQARTIRLLYRIIPLATAVESYYGNNPTYKTAVEECYRWNIVRELLIAILKPNEDCPFAMLPREIVMLLVDQYLPQIVWLRE